MIHAYNKETGDIRWWDVPADGFLKAWLPFRCKADCCDIECSHGEDDPSCPHTTHETLGHCVVAVTLDPQDDTQPLYECLGQINRGEDTADCYHLTHAECDCEILTTWATDIAQRNSPPRTVGSQKRKEKDKMAQQVKDEKDKRRKP